MTVWLYCLHTHPAGSGDSLKMIMALIGKSAVTVSSGMAYILAAELYPTQVRYLTVNRIMVEKLS